MKVLVVDDDVVSRMVLMHLVDSCGAYEIYEAEDGEDAWEQLQQGLRPAICFCDVRMPRLSGLQLLERVKADRTLDGMRFVLASSAGDHATMAQASSLGAGGYIVKPFQQDMVLAQMAGLSAAAEDVENPLATMQRLGISAERLQAYLGGFENQLQAGVAELGPLVAAGDDAEARTRVGLLHAGCVTLGLAGPAAGLDALATGVLDGARVQAALAAALAAVREQGVRVRRMES